jgi:hypothetical protein
MNLTDFVGFTGVEKNTLTARGFTRVNMRHNSDVSNLR